MGNDKITVLEQYVYLYKSCGKVGWLKGYSHKRNKWEVMFRNGSYRYIPTNHFQTYSEADDCGFNISWLWKMWKCSPKGKGSRNLEALIEGINEVTANKEVDDSALRKLSDATKSFHDD